ncbi:hypothetical protein D6833_03830, partial [Candidatus Parcubacteria bacterium]
PPFVLYTAIGMLLLAIAPMPYGYYTLLRFVATTAFVWGAVTAHKRRRPDWVWPLALFAFAFNPLIPVYLPKGTWVAIDILAAGLLFAARPYVLEPIKASK